MVQKCNICGKIASYFDANLGEWLCEECYKKNYNKVNLNDYRNKVNSEKYDEEIQNMLNAMENIIDDMMKNKMAKLDKRFNSTKFTNDIEEILKSMPRSDIESIAERLNFAKTYKYNKDKLIHNLISSYKERVLEKIYLFNDNALKAFKYFSKNDGITILNNSDHKYIRFMEYFMSIGILYPAKNEEKKAVLIMPSNVRDLLSDLNDFNFRLKVKNNSKIITLVSGMANVYGVLTINNVVNKLNKFGFDNMEFKEKYDVINSASNYSVSYVIKDGYVFNCNIKHYKKLYEKIESESKSIEYREYSEKELLTFGKDNWLRNSKYGKEFIINFTNCFELDNEEIDEFLKQLYYIIQEDSLDNLLDEVRDMIVEEDGKEVGVNIIKEYVCNLPIWYKKGKSINEIKGKSI